MTKKLMTWKTKGMNRDLSVSAFNPEFSFENLNLRLATNDGNTTLSWVNERGTATLPIARLWYWINNGGVWEKTEYIEKDRHIIGTPIGTAIINKYFIIFTCHSSDISYIYKFWYSDSTKSSVEGELLYSGSLGLKIDHPLETLVSYESEEIQKVYWTDGINQPRMINIADPDNYKCLKTAFDFIPELQLNETVKVQKILGGGGMFAPGVIQYAFTYYNKYRQESNIFYTTPLYYISYVDRGGSPEDKIDNIFKITVSGVDNNFEYLRIYSIQRTSINGTPICKRLQDIEISGLTNNTASYIDTGFSGNSIDPTELLYKGGNSIIVGTMEQKDNTLFMGDITTPKNNIPDINPPEGTVEKISLKPGIRTFYPQKVSTDNYEYSNQLTSYEDEEQTNSVPCAGFKYGDKYRCGLQFQDATGKWSDPVIIDDDWNMVDVEVTEEAGEDSIRPKIDAHIEQIDDNTDGNTIRVNVIVQNNTNENIAIGSEASFLVYDSESNPAVVLPVFLFEGSTYEWIDANTSKTFANAEVRLGKNYSNNRFCNTLLECQSVNMPDNALLSDAQGRFIQDGAAIFELNDDRLALSGNLNEGGEYTLIVSNSVAPEPTPTPTPDPGDSSVTFVLKNQCGQEVRLSGRSNMLFSKNPRSWSNAVELATNMHGPQIGASWAYNDIIIQDGGTYTWTVELPNTYLDKGYYFLSSDKDADNPAIRVYSRIWRTSKNVSEGSTGMYRIYPLLNMELQKNATYNLTLYRMNENATLAPDNSGHYVIMELGEETID